MIQSLGIYALLPTIRNMAEMAQGTLKDRAITVARERGIARARDFDAAGIPRAYLRRLQKAGRDILKKAAACFAKDQA